MTGSRVLRVVALLGQRELLGRLRDRALLAMVGASALGALALGVLWALVDPGVANRPEHRMQAHAADASLLQAVGADHDGSGPHLHLSLDERTATVVAVAIGLGLAAVVLVVGPATVRGAAIERRTRLADALGPLVGPGRLFAGRVLGDAVLGSALLLLLAATAAAGIALTGHAELLADLAPALLAAAPFCLLAVGALVGLLAAGSAFVTRSEDAVLLVVPLALAAVLPAAGLAVTGADPGPVSVLRWLPIAAAAAVPAGLLQTESPLTGPVVAGLALPLVAVACGTLALLLGARSVHARVRPGVTGRLPSRRDRRRDRSGRPAPAGPTAPADARMER